MAEEMKSIGPAELKVLQMDVLETLAEFLAGKGIPFDGKPFCPHITLARKPAVPEGVLLPEIAVPRAAMTVRDVCLYRSDRGANGMEYTVIGRSGG